MRWRMPDPMVGLAVLLAVPRPRAVATSVFSLEPGSHELMLDRTATIWVAEDAHWFEQVIVVGDLDGNASDDAIVRPPERTSSTGSW